MKLNRVQNEPSDPEHTSSVYVLDVVYVTRESRGSRLMLDCRRHRVQNQYRRRKSRYRDL